MSEILQAETYLAYYWQDSFATDGWFPRKTVACDSMGRIDSEYDYRELVEDRWISIGFYKFGDQPEDVWDVARHKP